MRRGPVVAIAAAVIALILYSKELERRGALTCDCDSSCWCRRTGLSAFRHLVPARHRCLQA